jgi:hypothetical protein
MKVENNKLKWVLRQLKRLLNSFILAYLIVVIITGTIQLDSESWRGVCFVGFFFFIVNYIVIVDIGEI